MTHPTIATRILLGLAVLLGLGTALPPSRTAAQPGLADYQTAPLPEVGRRAVRRVAARRDGERFRPGAAGRGASRAARSRLLRAAGPVYARPRGLHPRSGPPAPSATRLGRLAQRDGSAMAKGSGPRPQAPFPGIEFEGLDQSNCDCTPADASIAAGPEHVVTALNSAWEVFDKAGNFLDGFTLEEWFAPILDPEASLYSPRVAYDASRARFILLVAATDFVFGTSEILLSVSPPGSALGEWELFRLDASANGAGFPTANYIDSASVGLDSRALYVAGNMFSFATNTFRHAKVLVVDKARLYSGFVRGAVVFDLIDAFGEKAFGIQPAHVHGFSSTGFLVSARYPGSDVVRGLTLWYVFGPTWRPRLLRRFVGSDEYATPPPGLQPPDFDTTRLDLGDGRLQNAVYRSGQLYTAHTTAIDWGDFQVVAAVHYFQIDTRRSRLVRELYYGGEQFYYSYPAISPDAFGNVAILFNRSAVDEYASVRYTGRKRFDAGSFLQASAELAAGQGQLLSGDPGLAFLGNYNGIALDPADPGIFWLFGMYAVGEDFWGSRGGDVGF